MDTNTNTTVVNLTAFIIPNPAAKLKEFGKSSRNHLIAPCTVLGIPASNDPEEKWINMWILGDDPKNDNFSCHGYSDHYVSDLGLEYYKKPTPEFFAPKYIPLNVLREIKEGDTKEFESWNGVKVRITFEQKGHRYERHGKFEETLRNIGGF